MRPEIQEVLQDKLESFVAEHLNDAAKNADGGCCGIHIANPELRYYKGYIDGICCALKCKTWGLEGDTWVVRDGRNRIVASCKNAWEED
jgi:hypothetical protein